MRWCIVIKISTIINKDCAVNNGDNNLWYWLCVSKLDVSDKNNAIWSLIWIITMITKSYHYSSSLKVTNYIETSVILPNEWRTSQFANYSLLRIIANMQRFFLGCENTHTVDIYHFATRTIHGIVSSWQFLLPVSHICCKFVMFVMFTAVLI